MDFIYFESSFKRALNKTDYAYNSNGHGYPWVHWQDSIEFHRFRKDGFVILDGQRYDVPAGGIAAINPYVLHSIDEFRGGEIFHDCLIIQSDFFIKNGLDFRKILLEPVITDDVCSEIYTDIITSECEGEYDDTAVRGKILLFLSKLAREYSIDAKDKKDGASIIPALLYISDNFDKKITIDSLAQMCNMSKYYFCRIFKKKTECTAIEYINRLRCSKASMLISKKGYSVNQAARECGFDNMSYFARTFKKLKGHLPETDKNG